jgi:hypothetical protein
MLPKRVSAKCCAIHMSATFTNRSWALAKSPVLAANGMALPIEKRVM